MTNSERYRFKDFTLDNYGRLLKLALQNYEFISFTDKPDENKRQAILRHDVEFSIPIALRMAEIEASSGIQSTYFLQVHGDFYNILEKINFQNIKRIQSLGHSIGLHFDPHFWGIKSVTQLEKCIARDKSIIKLFFDIEANVFSFHNTNSFIITLDADHYAGMINVYSKNFKLNWGYCADSTGYWRYEVLEERLRDAKDKKIQLLIHDGMWQDEVLPPRRRIYRVIDDHAEFMKKSYDNTLKKFGAKNIDWNEVL